MAAAEFPLPDVGEGLTEAEIVQWRVAIGDEIAVDQVLVEIETAKSLVELPSPFSGTVTGLLVAEGDTVEVGTDHPGRLGRGRRWTSREAHPRRRRGSRIARARHRPRVAPAPSVAPADRLRSVGCRCVRAAAAPAAPAPRRSGRGRLPPHGAGRSGRAAAAAQAAAPTSVADGAAVVGTDETSGAVLVGYGSATSAPSRRKPGARRAAALAAEASRASSADAAARAEAAADPVRTRPPTRSPARARVRASRAWRPTCSRSRRSGSSLVTSASS